MIPNFEAMPKIPRWSRDLIITEKIDGTNASIFISPEGEVQAGSRTRWITTESDNYGFAQWVKENEKLILRLGIGHHFGEWWGLGIQRAYDMKEKRFSLFNVGRWTPEKIDQINGGLEKPFFFAVPTIRIHTCPDAVEEAMFLLKTNGSYAAPGFMRPEGIVIYHTAGGFLFKKTFEKDEKGKGG